MHVSPRHSASPRIRPALALVWAAALGAAALIAFAAPANATTPSVPANIHVVSATPTSVTIGMSAAANAQYYRVYASTTRSYVYAVNVVHAHASALSTTPTVTVSGLTYTAAAYNYRVETYNGSSHAWSDIYTAGLRPATPTSVSVSSSSAGTWVSWSSGAATGAIITQASNAAMTVNRRDFVIRGTTHVFSPYGLPYGATAYYRVRARTVATPSSYSAEVTTVIRSHEQGVRVMTYNVLEHVYDGNIEGGQHIASWSSRQPVVASLIKEVRPDVLAVQEAESWTTGVRGPRQIDSLTAALGSPYRIARTEVPPTEPGYYRAGGNYIVYNSSVFEETGHGSHWPLPYGKFAAYSVLRNRYSGAQALFISTHFVAGNGASYDAQRETEMKALMATVAIYRPSHGNVPVIYLGDFNSTNSASHAFDGVAIAAAGGHLQDADKVAQYVYNHYYNSANEYLRTAAVGGYQIDHIFAAPGVLLSTWHEVLHLSGGKFVGVMGSDHNPIYSAMSYPY